MKGFTCCSGPCQPCANNTERTGVDCGARPADDFYIPFDPIKEAKRLAARGDFDPPANGDDCVCCEGRNGGVPGNENMINGEPVCDYCAQHLGYTQKIVKLITRLQETRNVRVQVQQGTCLYIIAPGVLDTYKTSILPLICDAFPEAYTVDSWFTPEPWASDPNMRVTISLDPRGTP